MDKDLFLFETVYPKDVSVQVTLGGSAILNADFTTSVAAQLMIPEGQKSAVLNFAILNDGMLGPDKVLTVTMSSPINAILGSQVLHMITIVNNILGPFSISGITGPGDVTLDPFLNGGVLATVNWSASVGAANYDVTVLQNDGLTVQCALVNTVATSYSFAACPLVAGTTYKVKMAAKSSTVYRDASNNIYSFMVNSPPTPAVTPIRLTMTTGNVATDVLTGASCAFAGCTLAVQSATNGAGGTTSISGNNITYVPNASFTGTDSFSYVISDGRGGSASSTINVKVMGAFTWTGAGGSSNWTAVNNWCGSLNVAQTVCVGGPAPGTSGVAIFDGTCTSNCSAVINASIDVGAIALNAGYTATLTQGAGFTIITEPKFYP